MKTLFIVFALITIIPQAFAGLSQRRCMLLPVKDHLDGAIGFKVFQEVENYLRESSWCYYRPNSEILNVLGSYRKNLDEHLSNPDVLKVLAQKTQAGSLIKIKIDKAVNGASVEVKIIGENGEDLYLQEQTRLDTDEITIIAQTVNNWLDVYEKNIPYDAKVIGVLGNQFTIDAGKGYGLQPQDEVLLIRPVNKKRHPLLKEIVDWDTEKIGSGKITFVADAQSQGAVGQYDTPKKMRVDDWVIIQKKSKEIVTTADEKWREEDYSFGKLGLIGINFNIGSGSVTTNTNGSASKKIGGTNFGLDLRVELWATRNFWTSLEISRETGSYKKKEGTLQSDTNDLSFTSVTALVGYKYLPLGFFYGPQVDGYLGYASAKYGLDTQAADGFTEFTFSGLMLGVRGSVPIVKEVRGFIDLGFIFNPGFEQEVEVFATEEDSTSHYKLQVGASYLYSPSVTLDGAYQLQVSQAKFVNPVRNVKAKDSSLKFGATYTF